MAYWWTQGRKSSEILRRSTELVCSVLTKREGGWWYTVDATFESKCSHLAASAPLWGVPKKICSQPSLNRD